MDRGLGRRQFLVGASVGLTSTLSGCLLGDDEIEGRWPLPDDLANWDAYNPATGVPETAPDTDWSQRFGVDEATVRLGIPQIADGRAVVEAVVDPAFGPTSGKVYALGAGGQSEWVADDIWSHGIQATVAEESIVVPGPEGQTVRALDPTDGTTTWETSLSQRISNGPFVLDGHVSVATGRQTVARLDIANGEVIERLTVEQPLRSVGLLAFRDNQLVAFSPGYEALRSFDTGSGALEWERTLGFEARAVPVIGTASIVVQRHDSGGTDGILTAIDRDDGSERWRRRFDGWELLGQLLTDHRVVLPIVPHDENGSAELAAIDLSDGDTVWREPTEVGRIGMWVGAGDAILTSHGDSIAATNLADGSIRWRQRVRELDEVTHMTPAGGSIYATGKQGAEGVLVALS